MSHLAKLLVGPNIRFDTFANIVKVHTGTLSSGRERNGITCCLQQRALLLKKERIKMNNVKLNKITEEQGETEMESDVACTKEHCC